MVPKDKTDQFYEWLSGEISPEDAKRIKAYCFSPRFEGRSNSFVCPLLEIFFSRELKGKKPYEQLESDLKSIQSKHHEAIRPLLFMWVNLTEEEDDMLRQATADSIKHWCNVNYNLTNLRRKNVLKAMNPGYVDLLKSSTNFGIEEYDNLFGITFRKTMIELQKDEEARRLKFRVQSYSNNWNRNYASGNQPQQANRLVFLYTQMCICV